MIRTILTTLSLSVLAINASTSPSLTLSSGVIHVSKSHVLFSRRNHQKISSHDKKRAVSVKQPAQLVDAATVAAAVMAAAQPPTSAISSETHPHAAQ